MLRRGGGEVATGHPVSAERAELSLRVGAEVREDAWDDFVRSRPGSPYVQSSAWAEVKGAVGWTSTRFVVSRSNEIVGGCQLLVRHVPGLGALAYAPRGPLLADEGQHVVDAIFDAVDEFAREQRMTYVKLQPPGDQLDLSSVLRERSWVQSGLEAGTTATVRIELEGTSEQLFARMGDSTRNAIRSAERKGATVLDAGIDALPRFSELVEKTSRRQQFSPYSADYYGRMWRSFAARGEVGLLFAEHAGERLAAVFLVGFGDTVVYKMGAWSGTQSKLHASKLVQRAAIEWALERGYRYYDFDGIETTEARALLAGAADRSSLSGVTSYKLSFGGDVVVFPPTFDRSYRPLLAGAVRRLAPRLRDGRIVSRFVGRGRAG